jgi:anti-sigma factor RsiW
MSKDCEKMQDKIVDYILGALSQEDGDVLNEHIAVCSKCGQYMQTLKAEKSLLREFAEKVDTGMEPREERMAKAITSCGHPRWKWYLSVAAPFLIWRRSSARRRVEQVAAAVLIAGIAFLGGRLSAPRKLPRSVDVAPQAVAEAETDSVNVPSDLVAWLDAARLFRQLGMEERMADAVESAGRLLPSDAVAASSVMGQSFTRTGDDVFENQNKHSILTEILGPHESVGSISGIMAQSFGDYYENEMD